MFWRCGQVRCSGVKSHPIVFKPQAQLVRCQVDLHARVSGLPQGVGVPHAVHQGLFKHQVQPVQRPGAGYPAGQEGVDRLARRLKRGQAGWHHQAQPQWQGFRC